MKALPNDFNFGIGQKVFVRSNPSLKYVIASIEDASGRCVYKSLSLEAQAYLDKHNSTINADPFYKTLVSNQSGKEFARPGDVYVVDQEDLDGNEEFVIPYGTDYQDVTTFPFADGSDGGVRGTLEELLKFANRRKESEISSNASAVLSALQSMQVFGQKEASESVIPQLKNYLADIHNPERPIFSSIFVGPTGVGKTELAKEISKATTFPMVRFDMSEFGSKHEAARFLGSPQGYIGSGEPSILESEMKGGGSKVVLFDEIEKADPEILRLFLQVIDDGKLSLSNGTKINFKNCIVIFTSNLGVVYKEDGNHTVDMNEIKKSIPPELIGRIDKVTTFKSLDKKSYELILAKIITNLNEKRLSKKGITLTLTQASLDHLLEIGISTRYGARSLKAAVEQNLTSFVADQILSGQMASGEHTVDFNGSEFVLQKLRLVA